MFSLRFDKNEVEYWADRYEYPNEDLIEKKVGPHAKAAGYFTKYDFLALCRWKTPRTQHLCEDNCEEFIRAVTQTALSTPSERLRIEVLTLLRGVRWPTASTILHFAHQDPYPVLDFRALWSLNVEVIPQYDFDFWRSYTQFCRQLARECNVTMRVLDRALWQYSKENRL